MKVKRIGNHQLPLPARHTALAAGYDLQAAQATVIRAGDQVLIPCGFAFSIPAGWVGRIEDRSGIAKRSRLTTRAGTIDADYTGEVYIMMVNEGPDFQRIAMGDRIAQMVVIPHWAETCEEFVELVSTVRGTGGFGHTGTS